MARVRFKKKFFIFVGLFIISAALIIIFVLNNQREGTATNGSINLTIQPESILIRDEVSVSTEKFDKIIFKVPEAERTENGTLVAQIFKWGYNDEIMQSLLSVQKEILSQQLNQLEGIENPELTRLNGEIESILSDIRSVTMNGEPDNLLILEWTLKELMQQRIEYLKSSVQATEILNTLYAEEHSRFAQIEGWKSDIVTTESGLVSFYFDGFEQILNAKKMDTLNADLIKKALRGSKVTDSSVDNFLYRLINVNHWYCAFITPSSQALRLVEGEEYTVIFEGHYDRPYVGRALKPTVSGNDVVNVLEFGMDIGPLHSTRTVNCIISKEVQGTKVPLDAIEIKDGLPGINMQINGKIDWVEVDVLAADDEHAVIKTADKIYTIASGAKYIKP